jgi:hypothetical protein
VAAAIFENIVDKDFGGKSSLKGFSSAEKSKPKSEFCELVKEKTKSTEKENCNPSKDSEVKSKDQIVESSDIKLLSGNKEKIDNLVEIFSTVSEDQLNIVSGQLDISAEDVDYINTESIILPHPTIDQLLIDEVEAKIVLNEKDMVNDEDVEQLDKEVISDDSILVGKEKIISESNVSILEQVIDTANVTAPLVAPEIVNESVQITPTDQVKDSNKAVISVITEEQQIKPIDFTKLSTEEQALHQRLKKIDIPTKGLASQPSSKSKNIKPVELDSDAGMNKSIVSNKKLGDSLKVDGYKVESSPVSKAILENEKPLIFQTLNLALAETTKQGGVVISKMGAVKESKEASVVPQTNDNEFVVDTDNLLSDPGNKNNNFNSRNSLGSFGAVMERASDEMFNVTFKGYAAGSLQNDTLKPAMQVSLAVNEVVNSALSAGKKQIIINLHPQTLGAVKVEILSHIGQDGASKLESIKISADKHDTLIMLEERRADLAKSLKEVSGTKEEANLQFETRQDQGKGQQGAYFTSLEERDNWVSQFVGLVAGNDLIDPVVVDEYETRGIANDKEVNLVA